jgi:arylsulfatase A-like enzyme
MPYSSAARPACVLACILAFLAALPGEAGAEPPEASPSPAAKLEPQPGNRAAWDLLSLVGQDHARSPNRSVVAVRAYDESRISVRTRPPDRISYPVAVPENATLDFGYAVQATAFTANAEASAPPIRLRVVLTGEAGDEHVLLDQVVDIRNRSEDRRWFDRRIDLSALASTVGTLVFDVRTDDGKPAPEHVAVVLAAPRILRRPDADDVNLLLVTIDCLRSDHVGAYGYARPTTPVLDGLAAEGLRFRNALSNAPMTLPSMPQLFTSQIFPAGERETLITPIATAGIPSAAIVDNVWLVLWLGLGRETQEPSSFDTFVAGSLDARAITDRAIEWLERHEGERFALYLHYLDAHVPYGLMPDAADIFRDPEYHGPVRRPFDDVAGANAGKYDARDRERIVSLYDGAIRWIDTQLGRLLDHLRRDGRLDRTVVLVTADHGEELWDHGGFFHGQSLYDELLHVPMLVRLPRGERAGSVIARPVRAIDVAPGLLDWANLPRPKGFAGRSLRSIAEGPDDDAGEGLVATATNAMFPTRYGLRTPAFKLVESLDSGSFALFDLTNDPGEKHDVSAERSDVASALRDRLEAAREPLRRSGYQIRIVGPASTSATFRLDLSSPKPSFNFSTIDRTGIAGDTTAVLSQDGQQLHLAGTTDARGRGFRFERTRATLARAATDDQVKLALTVDGREVPPDATQLGAARARAGAAPIDLRADSLEASVAPDCPAPEKGVNLCVWRYPVRAASLPDLAAPDADTRERLRSLGYVP